MEPLLIVFLLALAERDEAFRNSLSGVLDFYRKNRELLRALSPRLSPESAETDRAAAKPEPAEGKKNSSAPGGEELRVLEELLAKI